MVVEVCALLATSLMVPLGALFLWSSARSMLDGI